MLYLLDIWRHSLHCVILLSLPCRVSSICHRIAAQHRRPLASTTLYCFVTGTYLCVGRDDDRQKPLGLSFTLPLSLPPHPRPSLLAFFPPRPPPLSHLYPSPIPSFSPPLLPFRIRPVAVWKDNQGYTTSEQGAARPEAGAFIAEINIIYNSSFTVSVLYTVINLLIDWMIDWLYNFSCSSRVFHLVIKRK